MENDLLTCVRYIELNSVRAIIVKDPVEYPWTSYSANVQGVGRPIVDPNEVFMGRAIGHVNDCTDTVACSITAPSPVAEGPFALLAVDAVDVFVGQ